MELLQNGFGIQDTRLVPKFPIEGQQKYLEIAFN
jgi:hypothetical protein